jgi:MFS family permease
MEESGRMGRLCGFYIRRVKVIGVCYCAVPTLVWFGLVMAMVPFRPVYALRLALSLAVGGWIGARLNHLGLSLWLTKHNSQDGPGTVADGALIGAAVGIGTALVPPLTSLIRTHHLEEAKSFIIWAYLAAVLLGALVGGALAAVGRRHMPREEDGAGRSEE